MLMKFTIKAKGFIYIYSSGAEQFRASCLSPVESHPRAHARAHVPAPMRAGAAVGVGEASASEAPSKAALPYLGGLFKSSEEKALLKLSGFKQPGVWL